MINKGDGRVRVPKSRYNVDAFYSPDGKPGTTNTQHGYFLDESVDLKAFDTSYFRVRKGEPDRMDPVQRLMMEVVREALEDAGEVKWRGRNIGCYMASYGQDWYEMTFKEDQAYGTGYKISGREDFFLANRISFDLDIHGPSVLVRTACSSSMVALHEACQAIERGHCESAIIGGANLIMAPQMTVLMAEHGVLSPDGNCKTFSSEANGYARAEAVTAIYIKPLSDAIRDGNPIRAVIRSTASNSDGQTPFGMTVPNTEAQVALMKHAYAAAGIDDYSKTAFMECHGTGTAAGDPRETDAVAEIFGPTGGIHIGSVKPNLGHSEAASGLTSIMKAVMALEHKTLPPNIKLTAPNPAIKWDQGLVVPLEPTPWPHSRHERISINNFGIGGSNAHVILDSAESFGIPRTATNSSNLSQLLVLSGTSSESIDAMAKRYLEYLDAKPGKLADLAYTLANRREHWVQRAFAVVKESSTLSLSPIVKVTRDAPKLVMVFTGQGAQWPFMGRELLQDPRFHVFQQSIRTLDQHLQSIPDRPDWHIESELLQPPETSKLGTAELSQPLCTAIQIALVDLFASVGIAPAAVVGHSSGELAAAYAAGALTAREVILAAFQRGAVSKLQTRAGSMAAVGMSREDVKKFLINIPGVVVACENSPQSVTISGDLVSVKKILAKIKDADDGILARILKVDKAYHSHHMKEIGELYHSAIEKEVLGKRPNILFASSVTGALLDTNTTLGARYWQRNLESPVLFQDAVTNLLLHDSIGKQPVLLEVGPHAALSGPLRQIQSLISKPALYVSALSRNDDGVETFLAAIGKLWASNISVDFKALIPQGTTLPDLPRYPWNHSLTFWDESRLSKEWRNRRCGPHDLLGVRITESTEFNPSWRNVFHPDNVAWIRDHKVEGDIVFPFVGYVGMVGEAIRQISMDDYSFELRNVIASTALVLSEAKPVEIITSLRKHKLTNTLDSQWFEFTIASHNGHAWTKHCTGEARSGLAWPEKAAPHTSPPRVITSQRCYDTYRRSGLKFGPAFRTLEDIRSETMTDRATARAKTSLNDRANYYLHPVLLDANLQLLAVAASRGFSTPFRMMVPTGAQSISICRTNSPILEVTACGTFNTTGSCFGDTLATADGYQAVKVTGLRFTPIDDGGPRENINLTARLEWGPHIDFQHVPSLFKSRSDQPEHVKTSDDFFILCLIQSLRRIEGLQTDIPHLQKYLAWMQRQAKTYQGLPDPATQSGSVNMTAVSSVADVARMSDEEISSQIDLMLKQTVDQRILTAMEIISAVSSNLTAILTGQKEALEVLMAEDLLTRFYRAIDEIDRSAFFQCLAFSNPHLRILEIGAGTGGTTAAILEYLKGANDRFMFGQYCYTDISAAMFIGPKERFRHVPNMEFAVLDITKDPAEQGFGAERKFDLVIATNVLHATPSIQASLANVRKLLASDGRLFLTELTPVTQLVSYIFGLFPGWWDGEADGRVDEPYISPDRWEKELTAAGFDGLESAVLDGEAPYQLSAMMVSKLNPVEVVSRRVTILCHDVAAPNTVVDELTKRGYAVDKRTLNGAICPVGQDIIVTLDLDGPLFTKLSPENFRAFQKFMDRLDGSRVIWLTRPCQMRCTDPRYSLCLGVARSMRTEHLMEFGVCEVDDYDTSAHLVVDVFERFQRGRTDGILWPDMEYIVSAGVVHVSRILPFRLRDTLKLEDKDTDEKAVFGTQRTGRLDDLSWTKHARVELKDHEVEIEAYASGLNFKVASPNH